LPPNTDTTSDSDASTPRLGSRENFWGGSDDLDADRGGHSECLGTDPPEHIAQQLVLHLVDPVCNETGRPLSEPVFHLPKQQSVSTAGHTIECLPHRHRRRIEEHSGRINWGETTSTDIPEFEYETYRLCVHRYLAERDCRLTSVDEYLEYAEQVWRDPQYGSKDALVQFIRKIREWEDDGADN
jgi:hypothetical protein